MKNKEIVQLLIGVIVLFVVAGIGAILNGDLNAILQVMLFSVIAMGVPVITRKAVAHSFDAEVEHKIWYLHRYGWRQGYRFNVPVPFGVFVPLFISFFGIVNGTMFFVFTILTYETKALKHRVAKRFGKRSYTLMTDWHDGLIGAAGIVSMLVIAIFSYYGGFFYFAKLSAYYAFWNMIPFSSLDGTRIYFGNRIIYFVLAITSFVFALMALIL